MLRVGSKKGGHNKVILISAAIYNNRETAEDIADILITETAGTHLIVLFGKCNPSGSNASYSLY